MVSCLVPDMAPEKATEEDKDRTVVSDMAPAESIEEGG